MSASIALAETLDIARELTIRQFEKLKSMNLDLTQQLDINGKKLNSPLWIYAHLAWTENFLILKQCGNKAMDIKWLDELFAIQKPGEYQSHWPSLEEIEEASKTVHAASLDLIKSLSDDELVEENVGGLKIMGQSSKRFIIQHAIRHEGMHCGHLSWLVKLNS